MAIRNASGRIVARIEAKDVMDNLRDWNVDLSRREVFFLTRERRGEDDIRDAIIRRGLNSEVRIRLSALLAPHRIAVCLQHKLVLVAGVSGLIHLGHFSFLNAYDYDGKWRGQVKGVQGIFFKEGVIALDTEATDAVTQALVELANK